MKIAMLGSGFIARFYADSLIGHRRLDVLHAVYSRDAAKAKQFAHDYKLPLFSDDMHQVVNHPEVDVVVIALPNNLHLAAVEACAKAGKHVLCTKPLGRTAHEAKQMLDMVEQAGVMGGYLEDLCYTPKFGKSLASVKAGALGRVLWAKSREAHPGPHSNWFWDKQQSGGGCIVDLGCHCIEIARSYIGKEVRPVAVMCWAATQVHPIDAEDNAIGMVKYANGAIGQFEVSWCFRGGMDLRDEVMGTEGTIWINNFLRTGFDMFSTGKGGGYVAEKAESSQGWLFPVGDEVNELGYNHMFTDMFEAIEQNRPPAETFYDGYVVNAIIDAAYASAQSGAWEPVNITDWRGSTSTQVATEFASYDEHYYLIKEEILPHGERKLILKDKTTGEVVVRDI
ncbi:Gfo/Idh/MocA family protein [Mucilaginibacter phyllosphaerae]|uniref:Dehydrogenase n=1 Tax=Mucilaginibacter phyllosphaerae TaxID=1812349 RepID=A0A4Y8AM09_9SPHI|nr:Gfo/Idh/MocA family oxidoreductase [Mucilaginibacter phyllosphaerae]MBB3967418.1 putative dehydrogenase [Mucilaginibacter phyllosphaerae]TEW69512.1 Gfo/Idh/MocA family oxidoreductase [Mucilaginibacter phyllosphaerae]GGH20604.1 oxidoreductase [Mucilaginibacter phyllosphaerae]